MFVLQIKFDISKHLQTTPTKPQAVGGLAYLGLIRGSFYPEEADSAESVLTLQITNL